MKHCTQNCSNPSRSAHTSQYFFPALTSVAFTSKMSQYLILTIFILLRERRNYFGFFLVWRSFNREFIKCQMKVLAKCNFGFQMKHILKVSC